MSHRKNTSTPPLKTQAKALRSHLGTLGWDLTHSQSLEAVAKTHGYKDWNTASASVAITGEEPEVPPLWNIFKTDDGMYEANWGMNHVGTYETRQEAVVEARSIWSEQAGIPWPEYVAMRMGVTRQIAYADQGPPITTSHMDFNPTRLDHWLVPPNSDVAYNPVHKRVMKLLNKDGRVALFDCGNAIRPERWEDAIATERFSIFSTPTYDEMLKVARKIAPEGLALIIFMKPGHVGAVGSKDWFYLLDEMMALSPGTQVLVVSRGKDEGGSVTALSSPQWTRMAAQEWALLGPDGSKLQKHLHLKDLRCPHCSSEIERRPGMFFSRSTGEYPGLVCEGCEGLWDDPNYSFMRAVNKKEVFINGKPFRVGDMLFYQDICELVGVPLHTTVTYICGASERAGSLIPGETIRVSEGMCFTVMVTGNA